MPIRGPCFGSLPAGDVSKRLAAFPMYKSPPMPAVGIGGDFYMGNKVDGMMNENLPFGIAFQVAAGCMLTHMLISYLIKGVVMCKSVHVVALMLLSIAWFLGNIVPFFGAAVDLLGARDQHRFRAGLFHWFFTCGCAGTIRTGKVMRDANVANVQPSSSMWSGLPLGWNVFWQWF